MKIGTGTTGTANYEERLRQDWNWAMDEGDRFFRGDDAVFKTLRTITRRLDDLAIPYAVADGMALNAHGVRRLTVDVAILVTRESLTAIHERLEGRGYVPPFTGSKNLRDTEHGVRIEFLITGDYPGDGKPKPVAFPDPIHAGQTVEGIKFLNLPTFIDLKLASGMTGGVHRMKDPTDVVALISMLGLPAEFAEKLNPYVRDKFLELWEGAHLPPREP